MYGQIFGALVLLVAVGQSEAYVGLQWPVGLILEDADNYVYGLDATVIESWSAYLSTACGKAAEDKVQICPQCNGTMSSLLTGRLGPYHYVGKWYRLSTDGCAVCQQIHC